MKRLFDKIKEGCKSIIILINTFIRSIVYIILMIILSIYVLSNWDKCISMKFFDQFDGNNILFLVWLVLLILQFHDIEAKDFKLRRNMQRDYNNAGSNFLQNMRNHVENTQGSKETNGGEDNSE